MSIDLSPGFSVSVPFSFNDGPAPAVPDNTTPATNFINSNPVVLGFVYPDPAPGIQFPARSVRVDILAGAPTGAGATADLQWRMVSPYDGVSIINYAVHVNSVRGGAGPFQGSGAVGTASAPFRTPA